MTGELQIIDCHQHFYDSHLMRYGVFTGPSAGLPAVVGDYAALPRVYRPEDYARDVAGLKVVGSVWAEFISGDPLEEARWAAALNRDVGQPSGLITLVEFADPDLDRLLVAYQTIGLVRCVRQHMGLASEPATAAFYAAIGPTRRSGVAAWVVCAASSRLACEIEIFSSQLRDFADLAAAFPDQQFVLPVMGWPIDLTNDGHLAWKRDFTIVAAHPNVALKIFGLECIFGVGWTTAQSTPLDTRRNRDFWSERLHVCEPYVDLHTGSQLRTTLRCVRRDH
jgi:predicted TIM-barrel fold metal-dependent hydrolase